MKTDGDSGGIASESDRRAGHVDPEDVSLLARPQRLRARPPGPVGHRVSLAPLQGTKNSVNPREAASARLTFGRSQISSVNLGRIV